MKKKKVQLSRLALDKKAITVLSDAVNARIKGGATAGLECGEVHISNPGGALSCIGHTCESWNSELPVSCWIQCAEA